jgi:hypothetical protein
MRAGSVASEELSIARESRLWAEQRVVLVLVGETICPPFFSGRLWTRIPVTDVARQVGVTASRIFHRLIEIGGFRWKESLYVGGGEPSKLLEALDAGDRRRSYFELSVPLMKQSTTTLLRHASFPTLGARVDLVGKLLDLYADIDDELTRNNLVYLMSRLMPHDDGLAHELLRLQLTPGPSNYSERSFAVALASLGHGAVLDSLTRRMFKGRQKDLWLAHSKYHEFYYGGATAALATARVQLIEPALPQLSSLALATLAALSSNPNDMSLLEDSWSALLARGVGEDQIRFAQRAITKRIRTRSSS